jgi:hypothetical protein
LEIGFDKETVKPGDMVDIRLKTKPNSLVALSIIDKSLELLGKPNEISSDHLSNRIKSYKLNTYNQASLSSGSGGGFWRRSGWGYWKKSEPMKVLNVI